MNKTVTTVASFIFGAAVGAAATWKFVEQKYARIAQEEIDSVKETFSKRQKVAPGMLYRDENGHLGMITKVDEKTDTPTEVLEVDHETLEESKNLINYCGYSTPQDEKFEDPKPYVIPPEEFGELEDEGYTNVTLMFCSDQIVIDDNNDILENVNDVIGFESLNHFGEYENDSVYVRNDKLRCDYEILLDGRTSEQYIGDQANKRLGVL